jgi:hypothetical protein
MTSIWVRMSVGPTVEEDRESLRLATACREALLEHEHEHQVAFRGEVSDIFCHQRAFLCTSKRRDGSIVRAAEANFGDVHRVMVGLLTQQPGCVRREHLVEQEPAHANSAWR